jgi:hypothetical protein
MFSAVIFPRFSAEWPAVLVGWLRKDYVTLLVNGVGVHNDVDLQAPSPYKAFLFPKTWFGFIVSSCLSFKQIHKNFYVPHILLRIYKYFYTIYRYAPGRHIMYTQPHIKQNFIYQNPNWHVTQGTDELSDDGTQSPKHVGAAKCNNKLIRIDAFVGYS